MLLKPRPYLHAPLPDGRTHPSISLDKVYIVTSYTQNDFQTVNDRGEPIFVPRSLFDIVDDWVPGDWIREVDNEGWYWCGPSQCSARGFFERWHEESVRERQVFADVYTQLWRHYEKQLVNQKLVLVSQ